MQADRSGFSWHDARNWSQEVAFFRVSSPAIGTPITWHSKTSSLLTNPCASNERLPAMDAHALADDQQPIARPDRAAKARRVQAAKAEQISGADVVDGRVVMQQLCRRLALDDTRQQGIVREMSSRPEFVSPYVLVTCDDVVGRVHIHDGRQVLHVSAMRICPANRLAVRDDAIQIERLRIEDWRRRHGRQFKSSVICSRFVNNAPGR